MKLIDMHCDTLMKLLANPDETLHSHRFEISLDGLKKADSMVEFFACFTNRMDYNLPDAQSYDLAYQTVLKMIDRLQQEIARNPNEIALAINYNQIIEHTQHHKISAFLTVEEGGILNGKIERLAALYAKGVRLITLTWNYENSLAFPNTEDPDRMKKGLKEFGIETVEQMNQLGMIIDVSHLSDGGFWDVIRQSHDPIVASHSCARALCAHTRNLSPAMLKAIGENGGAVGVNFYGGFLHQDGISTAERIAEHLRYIADTAGIETAAIGTDFDGGISANSLEIDQISKIELLYTALRRIRFSEDEIEKIFYKNALRVIKDCVK